MAKKLDLGVDWYLPGKKRRFATTTKSTSDIIELLGETRTIAEIKRDLLYDSEGTAVLQRLCDEGYGHERLDNYVNWKKQ